MTDPNLSQQLSYLIARVNRMVEDDLSRRLQPGGFSIEHYRVLKVLDHERPLAMGELAMRVLVEPATLTKIIDRMVAEGLVIRLPDPADRRKVLISLSPAGESSALDLLKIGKDHEEHITQVLPKRDLHRIRQILSDLALS